MKARPARGEGRRRATAAVVAAFTLLASACVFAAVLAWEDVRATDAVIQARRARLAETLLLDALLNAETSQRGFLLTRDPAYLAPYDAARTEFEASLSELRTRLPDDPPRAPLAGIARIGAGKFGEMDRTIDLAKSGSFDAAVAVVRLGQGAALMNELRAAVSGLTGQANEEIARSTLAQREISALLAGAIVAALVSVAGLGLLLLYDARRYFGLLRVREANARELADALERRVARRTRELAETNQRFEVALRASGVAVMTQDRDLVFTWISRGLYEWSAQDIIGKTQQEVTPPQALAAVTNLKRGAIESGEPARGDFRIVKDGVETWYDLTVLPLRDEHGAIRGVISGAIDITRYKEQEARIRLLMRELTHRSKNILAVIQAIMRQTANNSESMADFETRFAARLRSLADSHDLLVQEDWQGASLRDLVSSQVGHYIDRADRRIELAGEPLQIGPDAAQHIGMAMHELATNAAKYGALSVPGGKVRVAWDVAPGADGTRMCTLTWEEFGGPPVERPSRRGFGRVVIERTVARALNGEVHIDYAPDGLRWRLEFPERIAPDR